MVASDVVDKTTAEITALSRELKSRLRRDLQRYFKQTSAMEKEERAAFLHTGLTLTILGMKDVQVTMLKMEIFLNDVASFVSAFRGDQLQDLVDKMYFRQ